MRLLGCVCKTCKKKLNCFCSTRFVAATKKPLEREKSHNVVCYIAAMNKNHQFSASAVELEFLRSERRLRSGRHFAQSAVYSRFRHSFYALLLLGLFFLLPPQHVLWLVSVPIWAHLDLTYGLAACFFALFCFYEGLQPIFGSSVPLVLISLNGTLV